MTVRELWNAIRKKCLDCVGEQPKEVRLCTSLKCSNWPYRMGKNYPKQDPNMPEIIQIGPAKRPTT